MTHKVTIVVELVDGHTVDEFLEDYRVYVGKDLAEDEWDWDKELESKERLWTKVVSINKK